MFLFSLAERLGMTVADLLIRLDVQELADWMAYARLQQDPNAFDGIEDKLKAAFRSISGKR